MKNSRVPIYVCLFMSLMLGINSTPVFSCSCVVPPPPKTALRQATAVFSGKVLSVKLKNDQQLVKFEVDRIWKGVSDNTVLITTGLGSGDCGYNFSKGEKYLVYAYGEKGGNSFSTSICTRTTTLANAQKDLAELGDGRPAPR